MSEQTRMAHPGIDPATQEAIELYEHGLYHAAAERLKTPSSTDEDSLIRRLLLGLCILEGRSPNDALEHFAAAVPAALNERIEEGDFRRVIIARAASAYGHLLCGLGREAEAESIYRLHLLSDASRSDKIALGLSCRSLGTLCLKSERYEEASELFDKAYECLRDSNYDLVLLPEGKIRSLMGRHLYDEARSALSDALRSDYPFPSRAVLYLLGAEIAALTSRSEDCVRFLDELREGSLDRDNLRFCDENILDSAAVIAWNRDEWAMAADLSRPAAETMDVKRKDAIVVHLQSLYQMGDHEACLLGSGRVLLELDEPALRATALKLTVYCRARLGRGHLTAGMPADELKKAAEQDRDFKEFLETQGTRSRWSRWLNRAGFLRP